MNDDELTLENRLRQTFQRLGFSTEETENLVAREVAERTRRCPSCQGELRVTGIILRNGGLSFRTCLQCERRFVTNQETVIEVREAMDEPTKLDPAQQQVTRDALERLGWPSLEIEQLLIRLATQEKEEAARARAVCSLLNQLRYPCDR